MGVQKREKLYPDEGVKTGYLGVAVGTMTGNQHKAQGELYAAVNVCVGLETTFRLIPSAI